MIQIGENVIIKVIEMSPRWVKIGIEAPDDDFGPTTSLRLHERQRGFPGASGSDGIYTPRLDEALGWAVFRA